MCIRATQSVQRETMLQLTGETVHSDQALWPVLFPKLKYNTLYLWRNLGGKGLSKQIPYYDKLAVTM